MLINDLTKLPAIERLIIYKQDNNIDGRDNLNQLPKEAAVYAITGRINNEPANCRFVGITDNLQAAVKQHFSANEPKECLRNFMQSIKIKMLTYQLIPALSPEEADRKLQEWENLHKPECNDKLNEVF